MNEYIWVLDYKTGEVYRYTNEDGLLNEGTEIEDFLISKDHDIDSIYYMASDSENPIYK